MAKVVISRNDPQTLAERLNNRSKSPILDQMPETRSDLKLAAAFLQFVVALGLPIGVVQVHVDNGFNT